MPDRLGQYVKLGFLVLCVGIPILSLYIPIVIDMFPLKLTRFLFPLNPFFFISGLLDFVFHNKCKGEIREGLFRQLPFIFIDRPPASLLLIYGSVRFAEKTSRNIVPADLL